MHIPNVIPGTILLLAAMWAPSPATAQDRAPGPVLGVSARSFTGGGTPKASATGTNDFVIGKPVTTYTFAGNLSRGDLSGCSIGSSDDGVFSLETLVQEKAYVWKVTTIPRSIEQGRLVFDLEWSRFSHAGGTAPIVSRSQQLTLAEGERYVIDLFYPTPDAACKGTSLVIDVEASAREDAALSDTLLQYELWLVHTDMAGQKQSRRLTTSGMHGMLVPFAFAPVRFGVPTLAPGQYDFEVTTRVSGSIRGRVGRDGKIVLDLVSSRRDALERRDVPRAATPFRGEGRKQLTLAAGEAVEIALPSGSSTSSMYVSPAAAQAGRGSTGGARGVAGSGASTPAATDPISVKDGRLVVRFKPFFEGRPVSLIVRATPVDQK